MAGPTLAPAASRGHRLDEDRGLGLGQGARSHARSSSGVAPLSSLPAGQQLPRRAWHATHAQYTWVECQPFVLTFKARTFECTF